MNDRRLSDAQISTALRAHLPARARAGLAGRITDAVEITPQQRSLPSILSLFTDTDPARARRNLLLAAMLLLALAGAAVAVAGAVRFMERQTAPPLDETAEVPPPGDLQALALSTYDRMPDLPPMSFTTLQDGTIKGRVLVSARDAVRIEGYASLTATQPDTYRILTPAGIGELAAIGDERVWVDQPFSIEEDPRVFVLGATEGAAASQYKPGCEFTREEIGGSDGSAGAGWQYVGSEIVIGRPTWHITCGAGDAWIDIETRLILRSRGPAIGPDPGEVPGRMTTVEVADLAFGSPPDELFDLEAPPGVESMTPEAYQCASQPGSCATFAPQPTPSASIEAADGPVPSTTPTGVSNGWIAYATGRPLPGATDTATGTDIYIVRAGLEPRLIAGRDNGLTRNVCPAFSPDGTKLAYGVANTDTGRSVVVVRVDADGTVHDAKPMDVADGGPPVCPRWSSDGKRIAYLDGGVVNVRGIDGSRLSVTDADPTFDATEEPTATDPLLSPAGDWVAQLDDACALIVLRPDKTDAHRLQLRNCPYGIAAWSPDGHQVLVMQDTGGFTIHAVDVTTGTDTTLVDNAPVNGQRAWPGASDVSWQPVVP